MVSPLDRPPAPSSPSFDSADLAPDDDRSLTARLDRALGTLERARDRPGASAAMALAALALLAGAWWLGRPAPAAEPPAIPMVSAPPATSAGPVGSGSAGDGAEPGPATGVGGPGASAPTTTAVVSTTAPDVLVHVAGAVVSPGIVRLRPGDRIADAVAAAGGPGDTAEVHRLNLAAPVVDGMQIVVPEAGEQVDHPAGVLPPVPPTDAPDADAVGGRDRPIDLNRADASALEALHGIGPALAAAIVTWRSENGPFATVEQLMEVPGIGPATLDGLIDQVTV